MKTGQVCLLGLLISTFTLITSAQPDKPGRCPKPRHVVERFPVSFASHCTYDSECDGDKKCCYENFHRFCKPPAKERDGSCPPAPDNRNSIRCSDNCTSDSECAPASKCCFNTCGLTCTPNVGVKPGFCYQELLLPCQLPERNYCGGSDTNCYNDEKCCPWLCRTECQKPVSERVGRCPPMVTNCPSKKTCNTDADCPTFNKCCKSDCGLRCLSAIDVPTFVKFGRLSAP